MPRYTIIDEENPAQFSNKGDLTIAHPMVCMFLTKCPSCVQPPARPHAFIRASSPACHNNFLLITSFCPITALYPFGHYERGSCINCPDFYTNQKFVLIWGATGSPRVAPGDFHF